MSMPAPPLSKVRNNPSRKNCRWIVAVVAPVSFSAYPTFEAPVDGGVLATCAALALCALLPFADRRGVGP